MAKPVKVIYEPAEEGFLASIMLEYITPQGNRRRVIATVPTTVIDQIGELPDIKEK